MSMTHELLVLMNLNAAALDVVRTRHRTGHTETQEEYIARQAALDGLERAVAQAEREIQDKEAVRARLREKLWLALMVGPMNRMKTRVENVLEDI